MTTKYAHLFLITSLITYILLFSFLSPYGFKHYKELKLTISLQEEEILKLERDVISLEKYRDDLKNGNYVLDNALELGYVNEGDNVYFISKKSDVKNEVFLKNNIINQPQSTKVTNKYKTNAFIFILSIIIGLVITSIFSVLSTNNTKKEANNERRDI